MDKKSVNNPFLHFIIEYLLLPSITLFSLIILYKYVIRNFLDVNFFDYSSYCFVIFLFFFFGFYIFKNRFRNDIYKPTKYLFPLYIISSFSFGIISILFGFHTDILTAYDNNEMNSKVGKWFKPSEILKFPIEQINIRDIPSVDTFNFKNANSNDTVCNVILFDKTLSVTSNSNQVNKNLKQGIQKCFSINNIDSLNCTVDLLPIYTLSELYTKYADSIINVSKFGVFYYLGDSMSLNNFCTSNVKYFHTCNELNNYSQNIFIDYVNSIMKIKGNQRNTDLPKMFCSLQSNILECNEAKAINKFNLYIISDFMNTNGRCNVKNIFNNISQTSKVNKIVLFRLNGKELNPSSLNFSDSVIQDIKDVFKELCVTRDVDFNNEATLIEEINSALCVDNFNNEKKLFFYYPYNNFYSNSSIKTNITLNSKNSHKYLFKIFNYNNPLDNVKYLYSINNKSKHSSYFSLNNYEYLSSNEILTIEIPDIDKFNGNRYIFEIIDLDDNKIETRICSILPIMPLTSTYYLFIMYALFIISVSFLMFFPCLMIYIQVYNRLIKIKSNWSRRFLLIPLSVSLLPIIYLFFLSTGNINLFKIYCVIFTLIALIIIPSFFYSYQKKRIKIIERVKAKKMQRKFFSPFVNPFRINEN